MQRTFDDFDKFASDYRNIHNQNIRISGADSDYFSRVKVEEIKKYEQEGAVRILDLGCGDGKSAEFFNVFFKGCRYDGIDVSARSIEEGAIKNLPNCSFKTYDGVNIPFEDETFDMVYIACVFHHIDFKFHEGILREVKRVLKKNGRIYMFEHNPYNPVTRKVVKDCPFDEDAVLLSPAYSESLYNKIGWSELRIKFVIFFPRHVLFKIFLWLEDYLWFIPMGAQYYVRGVK